MKLLRGSILFATLLCSFSPCVLSAEVVTGYRALPGEVPHPSTAHVITPEQFDALKKERMQEAPSMYAGHRGTVIWYNETEGYIVQVRLRDKPDVFVLSVCTFTPTMGMDMFDGMLAQDIEEYVLLKELERPTSRLDVFGDKKTIGIHEYLAARGVETKEARGQVLQ